MLDERILTLARHTAAPQLAELDRPLELSAESLKRRLRGFGHLPQELLSLYAREIGVRAMVVWRNLQRAHGSFGSQRSDSLRADLAAAFKIEVTAIFDALYPRFDRDLKQMSEGAKAADWLAKLTAAVDGELARYEAEVEHYVASLESAAARGAPAAASYTFHGNVGAVVTGQGAVANVVQNINPEQREELLKALEIVKHAIKAAPDLEERDRRELAEFADDAARELTKESPNTRRLIQALQTLAATVQGIASAPEAYAVLRAAAAAVGIAI